ncbi:hypothetical protein [Dactylosporangium sp. CA-092794]|uniref:hypothetical protein n=1 Tax=Dactylosporangium sp. CA-092794 TaxID=3239929 RepID=UPI003D93CE84
MSDLHDVQIALLTNGGHTRDLYQDRCDPAVTPPNDPRSMSIVTDSSVASAAGPELDHAARLDRVVGLLRAPSKAGNYVAGAFERT